MTSRDGASLSDSNSALSAWADMVWCVTICKLRDKQDAEDAFQNTFLALCKAHPPFESVEHQKAWLLRTACNCCNQILRKRRTHPYIPLMGSSFRRPAKIVK